MRLSYDQRLLRRVVAFSTTLFLVWTVAFGVIPALLGESGGSSKTAHSRGPLSEKNAAGGFAPAENGHEPKVDSTCPTAPVRPTYLPWLEEGEDVPPPRETYDESIDRSQLSWVHKDETKEEIGIGLTRYQMHYLGEGGEPIDVEIEGQPGQFFVGHGDGNVSIAWDLVGECNWVSLGLHAPSLSSRDLRQKVVEIAESFEPID